MLDGDYLGGGIIVAKAHGGGIVAVAVDTAHNTLIIAEEKDGETGYEVDGDEKSPLFIPTGYVVARDILHDLLLLLARGGGESGMEVSFQRKERKDRVKVDEEYCGSKRKGEIQTREPGLNL